MEPPLADEEPSRTRAPSNPWSLEYGERAFEGDLGDLPEVKKKKKEKKEKKKDGGGKKKLNALKVNEPVKTNTKNSHFDSPYPSGFQNSSSSRVPNLPRRQDSEVTFFGLVASRVGGLMRMVVGGGEGRSHAYQNVDPIEEEGLMGRVGRESSEHGVDSHGVDSHGVDSVKVCCVIS